MNVKIFILDEEGQEVNQGTLALKDGRIVAWPQDSPLLQHILAEHIMIEEEGTPRVIDPQNTPMSFLKNLHRVYSTPSLRATKARP